MRRIEKPHYPYSDASISEQTAMVGWIAYHYPQWLHISVNPLAFVSGAPPLPCLASLTPEQIALATKIVMNKAIDHPLETKGPSVSKLHL